MLLTYVFTFLVISVLPGDPVTSTLRDPENGFSQEEIDRVIDYYHLDDPLPAQLWLSLSRFFTGDLGMSMRANVDVSTLIGDALPSTLRSRARRCVVSLVLALAIAYVTQILPPRYGQGIVRALPSLSLSVPTFVIGILLVRVFAFQLGWFTILEPDAAVATLFAAVALGIPVSAQIAEVLVTNVDHERAQDYAAVARSRGLSDVGPVLEAPAQAVVAARAHGARARGGGAAGRVAHHRVDLRAQRHRQPRAEGGDQPGPARPAGGRVARRGRVRRGQPDHRPALPGARRRAPASPSDRA